jgi:hypothetical protein
MQATAIETTIVQPTAVASAEVRIPAIVNADSGRS